MRIKPGIYAIDHNGQLDRLDFSPSWRRLGTYEIEPARVAHVYAALNAEYEPGVAIVRWSNQDTEYHVYATRLLEEYIYTKGATTIDKLPPSFVVNDLDAVMMAIRLTEENT